MAPVPRPAATLVVLRDAEAGGLEVLLMRRARSGDAFSNAWVFPGGQVDAGDRHAHRYCEPLDDAQASRRLGLPHGGLDYYVAAIRECFEEAGILLATGPGADGAASRSSLAVNADSWRALLNRNELEWARLCEREGLHLRTGELHYFGHWITPLGSPKRYDTRFFLCRAPLDQHASHDGAELVELRWVTPAGALAASAEFRLVEVTQRILKDLARLSSVDAAIAWAVGQQEIPAMQPRMATGTKGRQPVMPDERAWAEIGRLDPTGTGTASCELVPGTAVRLSARVLRVMANNGSVMTGPGTNSYLVGGGAANAWAVIDPGPADERHVNALLAAAPGPIRWILATHTHKDHSPAVALLKAHTGATVYGRVADHALRRDASFVPDVILQHGHRLALPGASTLRAIHTPGHASNHFCFLLEEEKLLFTGDQIMQGSTVVIDPPDGSMAAYIASLRALLGEDLDWLAPGHGFLIADPSREIARVIEHRLRREAKVRAAMPAGEAQSEDELLARVYADVPLALHGVARRSLLAHLYKLREEGSARESGGLWRAI